VRCLVTGATGFIGRHIVRKLLEKERAVRILVRQSSDISIFKNKDVEIIRGDLCDADSIGQALKDVDIIYHAAALVADWGPKQLFFKTNFTGTKNLLEACKKSKIARFVHISTIDVFGVNTKEIISEKSEIRNIPYPYSYSKILAENLVWRYYKEYGIPVTVIYPSWIFGPGDKHFFPEIVDALKNKYMIYFGSGNNRIELSYVENLADGIVMLGENKEAIGEGYIISDGIKITFRQLVEKIAELTNLKKPKIAIPYPVAYAIAFLMEAIYKCLFIKKRPFLTRYAVEFLGKEIIYDTSKIRHQGFKPKIPFEEGMKNAIGEIEV